MHDELSKEPDMDELAHRTKIMGEILQLEARNGVERYTLSLGEMYLLSDGIRHLIEENDRLSRSVRVLLRVSPGGPRQ